MDILIHDLDNRQFKEFFPAISKDIYIISDAGSIRNCIGCFGCWIKAPGKCVINNGFFEGKQNHIASRQVKNWCKVVGLTWGQTVGVGAGEMLPFIKDIPLGYEPNKNIGKAFKELAHHITSLGSGKDLFVSLNWPRLLWKIQGTLLVWYPQAKKNGIKI